MNAHRVVVPALLVALLAAPARAQQDVKIEVTQVSGAVYMLVGQGGNIAVSVGEDGILMIDDQFAPLADKIRAAVKSIDPGKFRFVVNTHFHGDHTGGNPAFGTEATIIAHANARERLVTAQDLFGQVRPPLDPTGWPVITFEQGLSLYFNGEEVRVFHAPRGHTDGDAMIYFTRSNVLHIGDQLFSGLFPYVDLAHGGTLQGYVKNLDMVLGMEFPEGLKVIPGHGPLSTMVEVKTSHDMIVETSRIVREQMQKGRTLEQIKEQGLPQKYASFDWQFITTDTWIETIYKAYAN